jgi:hypothetical protein
LLCLLTLNKINLDQGFSDRRVRGEDQDGDGRARRGEGINPNIYAFGTTDGGVLDLLKAPAQESLNSGSNSQDLLNENDYTTAPEAGGSIGFESNYGKITSELDGLATGPLSNFNESPNNINNTYGEDGTLIDKYIWGDTNSNAPG